MIRLHHIAMYVSDLEEAKSFFQKYFKVSSNQLYHNPKTGLKTYFLSFPDGGKLEIMQHPKVLSINNQIFKSGFIHIAIKVGSRENVDFLTKELQKDGYEVLSGPRITGDGYYESCIRCIEGNIIEIVE